MLVLVLFACHRPPAMPPVQMVPPLLRYAPPPHQLAWDELTYLGAMQVGDFQVAQAWTGPTQEGDHEVFDVVETQVDDKGSRVRQHLKVFYGDLGMGYVGLYDKSGAFVPMDPPEIVLPVEPATGETWSQVHQIGPTTEERDCEIMASNLCDGGLVSVCEKVAGTSKTRSVMREHFCPNVGWSGFEVLVMRDQGELRAWSEKVVRDGVALPTPPTD